MQNDYIMKQQFGEIEYYNKSACEYVRVQNVKLNRTFLAYTFRVHTLIDWDGDSFKVNVQIFSEISLRSGILNFQMNIKGFRFENNLFRHKIFDFDLKICESFRKNYIGLSNLLKQGNLTECPIKKVINLKD